MNSHFAILRRRLAFRSLSKTASRCLMWSSNVSLNTMMSSTNARAKWRTSPSTAFMQFWKTPGDPLKPNGILLNSKTPASVPKAVFSLSASFMGICQNPCFRSRQVRNLDFPNAKKMSSADGMLAAGRIVIALSFLKSTQSRIDPSFFGTKMTGDIHGELLRLITLAASIS